MLAVASSVFGAEPGTDLHLFLRSLGAGEDDAMFATHLGEEEPVGPCERPREGPVLLRIFVFFLENPKIFEAIPLASPKLVRNKRLEQSRIVYLAFSDAKKPVALSAENHYHFIRTSPFGKVNH